jgi:hypothetical protein
VSTRVEGATALILVTVHATLSAGPAHLMLSAREGPAPGTWRYSLSDGKEHRIQCSVVVIVLYQEPYPAKTRGSGCIGYLVTQSG